MCQELIMKLQDQKTSNVLEYMVFNLSALLAIMLIAEPFAICGDEGTIVRTYQMAGYIPQALMMAVAPFLNYISYIEPIPAKWKAMKLAAVGVLFTVSMITAVKFGVPLLEAKYGSADVKLLIFPIIYYCNLAMGLMNLTRKKEEGEEKDDE